MTFDLKQLRAFVFIVEAGSLGRASAALHVTQPALSRTIRRLESDIGAFLFERHTKGMQLTECGEALLPHALLLVRGADQAREEIDALRGLARGTVRVGAVSSIACMVLPLALDRLLTKWPNLRVHVIEGVWDRLTDALIKREVDIALSMAAPDTDEIMAIPGCEWEDVSHVVAAADHPLRRKKSLGWDDLLEQRWTLSGKGTAPYEHMSKVLAANGCGMPPITVETRSITMMKSLIAYSGFLSWQNEPTYEAERKAGLIESLPLRGAKATRTLLAFRRRQGILPTSAVKLIEELRALTKRHRILRAP